VPVHAARIACERPDHVGRSLSQWFCEDLAAQLVREGLVDHISGETVRRFLSRFKLKPWRCHFWMNPRAPRDEAYYASVREIIGLYTRPPVPGEVVLSLDEKTSIQPRPRSTSTRPARPGNVPNLVEHEYKRAGALHLFAAFDIRTGRVRASCCRQRRQTEFIAFLEQLDAGTPRSVKTIHLVLDNSSIHRGARTTKWLARHRRFQAHFTPVGCSWLNQVEQWFSILQRRRFRIVDFASLDELRERILQFVREWNAAAHAFHWTSQSAAKVLVRRTRAA